MSSEMEVSYTPTRPYDASAGFSSGPSMLSAVRTWGPWRRGGAHVCIGGKGGAGGDDAVRMGPNPEPIP